MENQGRRPRWSMLGDVAKWRVRRQLQTGGGVLDAQRQLTWQRGGQEKLGEEAQYRVMWQSRGWAVEFFTVPHVFLPESAGIRVIPGIPWNGILAVLPAKIVISIPWNGIDWNGIHGIFFNGNCNF